MKTKSEYNDIISVFQQLHKKYPSYTIGQHISTALSDYPDVWGVENKEFLFAMNKYAAELEMNTLPDNDAFLKKVMEDAAHLFDNIIDDEDEDELIEEF